MLYGGIEAGGTKIVCAVGMGPADLRSQIHFPTTAPGETLAQIIALFQQQQLTTPLAAIGIGSLGPISTDPPAPRDRFILSPPILGYVHTVIAGFIARSLGRSVRF